MQMNEGQWFELPVSDQYQLEAEAFGRVIRKQEKPRLGRRRRHPEHENHRRLLPLRKKRQVGEAVG